jgi:hypothetical protein
MIDFMAQTHYVLNVALKPRFYALNFMQNVLALAPQVDTESLAHGIYEAVFNHGAATKAAREAGVIAEGVHRLDQSAMLSESVFSETRDMTGMVGKALDKMGWLAEQSEKMNRIIAYHAGLKHAELNGLTGAAQNRKALDIVKDAHFLYDAANRPVISNTPVGSLMFRYRTFSQNYASFLAQRLREGDPSRIAASFGALLGTAGTTGIPLYNMVRYELYKLGVEAPEVNPLDEMFGVDFGGAESPIPTFPTSPNEVLGPFWAQAQQVYETLQGRGQTLGARVGAAALQLGGSALGQLAGAAQEQQQGGVITSRAGREVRTVRSERDVALASIGFQPSSRALQAKSYRELTAALNSGNSTIVDNTVERLKAKGVRNTQETIRRIRAERRSNENVSALELLTRNPKRPGN